MNISWTADMNLTDKTYCGIIVTASLSQSKGDNDRRLCVQMNHEGTHSGLQLEDLDEVDDLIRILTAVRDKVMSLPEWDLSY